MVSRRLQRMESRLSRIAIEWFGARIDDTWILSVPGRRTGIRRHVPVKLLEVNGTRYLVALYGDTDWSRNLRAAGTSAWLRHGGRVLPVVATDLPHHERPRILLAYLAAATRGTTLDILGAGRRDPDEAHMRRIAADHPVFRLTFPSGEPLGRKPETRSARLGVPGEVVESVTTTEGAS